MADKPTTKPTPKSAPALEVDVEKLKELLTRAVTEIEYGNKRQAADVVREALKLLG